MRVAALTVQSALCCLDRQNSGKLDDAFIVCHWTQMVDLHISEKFLANGYVPYGLM